MALHLLSTGISYADFSDATESSELLDDYEEGAWSPNWIRATTNNSVSLTAQSGKYVVVGTLVHGWHDNSGTAADGAGTAQINGLPLSVQSGAPAAGGYGAPTFRATSSIAPKQNFNAYGPSSWIASELIYMQCYDSTGDEQSATSWQDGRCTGQLFYYTNSFS